MAGSRIKGICVEIDGNEELFTIGLVIDLMTEKGNDGKEYPVLAGQAQFDAF